MKCASLEKMLLLESGSAIYLGLDSGHRHMLLPVAHARASAAARVRNILALPSGFCCLRYSVEHNFSGSEHGPVVAEVRECHCRCFQQLLSM